MKNYLFIVLIIIGVLIAINPAQAAISFIQGNATTSPVGAGPTSTTCYLSGAVSQGDLIVGISQMGSYNQAESLTDSLGSSYTKTTLLNSAIPNAENEVVLWYGSATASSASDTLTFTTAGATVQDFMCAEYSGLSVLAPFDVATGTPNA